MNRGCTPFWGRMVQAVARETRPALVEAEEAEEELEEAVVEAVGRHLGLA